MIINVEFFYLKIILLDQERSNIIRTKLHPIRVLVGLQFNHDQTKQRLSSILSSKTKFNST